MCKMRKICNLAPKKSVALAATLFTILTNTKRHCVKILYTEFYPNW